MLLEPSGTSSAAKNNRRNEQTELSRLKQRLRKPKRRTSKLDRENKS